MHHNPDKPAEAKALVTTVEVALGSINADLTPQDAGEVRTVGFITVKRLRKIEKQMYAAPRPNLSPSRRRCAMSEAALTPRGFSNPRARLHGS
jgi:hypothetical protein